ncbi:MAG: nucleotidyltransferase family protein [Elusimicrobiota bacterium]
MEKAVILAGGRGVRFGTMSEELPKPMAAIEGKPILHYIISILRSMGLKQLYIIVGYKKEIVIDYFGQGREYGLNIEYLDNSGVNDPKKNGLSDAVLLLKNVINEPFLTILGDEIYAGTKHGAMLKEFEKNEECESMIAVHRTANPEEVRKNYAVKVDTSWNITDLEEKPKTPWNDLIGCGTYIFRESIFRYIEQTSVSERSRRKELADTLKCIINDKKIVRAFEIGGKYLNINFAEDMLTARKIIVGK